MRSYSELLHDPEGKLIDIVTVDAEVVENLSTVGDGPSVPGRTHRSQVSHDLVASGLSLPGHSPGPVPEEVVHDRYARYTCSSASSASVITVSTAPRNTEDPR